MIVLALAVALAQPAECPATVFDRHCYKNVPWTGRVVMPEFETDPSDFRYTPGTPRCTYAHDYRDYKGRRARHTIELRLRDGEVFHSAEVTPEKR
jgi:hypothetical protein